MSRASILAIAAALCWGCSSGRQEDPAGVLRQCRETCGHLPAEVTLKRGCGTWRPSGVLLRKSDVSDADLQHLARFPALDSLEVSTIWLGDGSVTPRGIQEIRGLRHLRRLRPSMALPQGSLKAIGSFRQLEELDLDFSAGIQGGQLAPLEGLTALRLLRLPRGAANDAALAHIEPLEALEELDLGRSPGVTDAGLVHLKGLRNLRSLDLSGTKVTDKGLSVLKDLPRLEHLGLGEDCAQADVSAFHSLTSVRVPGGDTDGGTELRLPPGLRRLEFKPGGIDPHQLPRQVQALKVHAYSGGPVDPKWLRSLPDLRELDMEGPLDEMMEAIDGLGSLHALTLFDCMKRPTAADMRRIAELRQLESLQLALYGSDMTDAGMAELGGLLRLRHLRLEGFSGVNPEGWGWLVRLKGLRSLRLNLGLGSADMLLSHVRTLGELEELSIHEAQLTDEGLTKLAGLKRLRRLDLSGSRGFTDDGLAALMRALPSLDEVTLSYESAD